MVLLSRVGLLTLTPVIAVGIAGTILLYRRGDRIEALLIWTICAAFVLYDTAYWLPLGGATPGPRFLMPILPFLAIATALSFERMPLTASVLAVPSIAAMLAVTITHPILAAAGGVVYRLRTRDFTDTVFTSLGIGGANVTAMVLVLLAAGAIALALAATPRPPVSQRGAIAAVSAALAWLVTALAGHEFVGSTLHQQNSRSDSLAALAVAGAASFVVAGLHKHALVPDAAAVAVGGSWRKEGTKDVVR